MNGQTRQALFSLAILGSILGGCTNMPANNTATSDPAEATAPVAQAKEVAMKQTSGECNGMMNMSDRHYVNNEGKPAESVRIRVTGYGAPPKAFYPDPQRRLMSMRAAKIDAYRNLAERVKGVQIWGGTTIGDMVVEKDRFRVYLDTRLSGARVIAENPHDDGTYETIVELKVGQQFLMGAGLRNAGNCNNGGQNAGEMPAVERSVQPNSDSFIPARNTRNMGRVNSAFYFNE